jgi:diaminohydroxyphosphoribosylaminopyrimidine deaminase/5-amino-6-(5-phosphoribosylamino)uracil reductase
LERLSAELYNREIQSFLLECGPDLAFSALKGGIIDKIMAFVGPKILGGREIPAIGGEGIESLAEAITLQNWTVDRVGPDFMITAYVHRHH